MDRVPVASSNVSSIGYDLQSGVLEVEFTSGEVYQYFNVPAHLHNELMNAASKGQFLDVNVIKYGYRYQKVR